MEELKVRTATRRGGALLLLMGLILGVFAMVAPGAGAAPGNQGTVKIKDAANGLDVTGTSNNPHVSCLAIEWWNFEAQAVTTYTVTQIAPTATNETTAAATWSGSLSALGGNEWNDGADGSRDAVTTPTLDLRGPAKAQGWHVNVHVETTDSNGAVTKDKTVWVRNDCGNDNGGGDRTSGVLEVSKTVVANDGGSHTGFEFSVSCPGAAITGSTTFTVNNGEVATRTVTGQLPLDCLVTETNSQNADATTVTVDNGEPASATSTSATVATGITTHVAFVNAYDPPTIKVVKQTTGNSVPANETWPFSVTCDEGALAESPATFSLAAGTSQTVDIAPGGQSCVVTETNAKGATSTSYVVGNAASHNGTSATVAVPADGNVTVVFTNDYTTTSGGGCTVNCDVIIPTPVVPAPEVPVVAPEVITPAPAPATPAAPVVEGNTIVAPAPAAPTVVKGVQLARTGVDTKPLLMAAGLCLLLGGVALLAGRKEQVATPTR